MLSSNVFASQSCYKRETGERQVEFSVQEARVVEIDQTKECFEASFEIHLRWALRREDNQLNEETIWKPPKLYIRNAKEAMGSSDPDNTTITCERPARHLFVPQPGRHGTHPRAGLDLKFFLLHSFVLLRLSFLAAPILSTPKTVIMNGVDADYKCKNSGHIYGQQRTRLTGTMLEHMELRSFPFDVQ